MNKTATLETRLVKPKDAAAYLAISERKLWDLSKTNTIAVVRLGRAVRYDKADLDAFIIQAKGGKYENGN